MREMRIAPSPVRPGIDLFVGPTDEAAVSPTWLLAGWQVQFLNLTAHQTHTLGQPGAAFVKVVTGRLAHPERGAYPPPREVRSTAVGGDTIIAGPDGALCALFTASPDVPSSITSIAQLRIAGPLDEAMAWDTFESRYTALTPYFDGLDAHLAPGWHLLDAAGEEIAHVFVWAAGKGVDMSTHNHGRRPSDTAPAFAEVHWVLANGTGVGGMYETPEPGSTVRDRTPMQVGEEHGPFFAVDAGTGRPRLRDNGAVEYPWHGWEAGPDDGAGAAYDVVVAFEITVPYALTV